MTRAKGVDLKSLTWDELHAEVDRRLAMADHVAAMGFGHNVILGASPAQRSLEAAQRELLRRALERMGKR